MRPDARPDAGRSDPAAGRAPTTHAAAADGTAVLFDLDGTLVATRRLYLEAYRRALTPFLGYAPDDPEILALKPRAEIRLLRARVGEHRIAACLEEFYRHYEALHDTLFGGVYPGVHELLETLRAAGVRTGIVTGKSRRAWEITAARSGLGQFDVVILDDDVTAPKPDPEGIRLALARLRADPAHTIYAGDSIADIHAARAAGARPAAALWAKRDDERDGFAARAAAEGAALLETPADLARLLLAP